MTLTNQKKSKAEVRGGAFDSVNRNPKPHGHVWEEDPFVLPGKQGTLSFFGHRMSWLQGRTVRSMADPDTTKPWPVVFRVTS